MNNNGHNGRHGLPITVGVNESPYLSPRIQEGTPESDETRREDQPEINNKADLPPAGPEQKSNRRRNALLFCVVALGLLCAGLGLYAYYGGRKRVDYRIAEKARKPGKQAEAATGIEREATDQATANAINQAKEELRRAGAAPSQEATRDASRQESARQIFTPYIIPETSAPSAAPAKETARSASDEILDPSGHGAGREMGREAPGSGKAASGGGGALRQVYRDSSQAATHSIYAEEKVDRAVRGAPVPYAARSLPTPAPAIEKKEVAVPSFGAMLPVRTLGAVYTLRSGLLTRLEATRDVTGDGWAIRRGTILVAQQQGSERDRAYLSLMGFIDPSSNRFVRLSGEVLGPDGAPGLKGKRRRIDGRWSRVFSRVTTGVVALGQAALSRGGATVILPGSSGLGNDFGLSYNAITRREFVEVQANAPAYVMITDLPKETRGVDADPYARNDGGALGDDELAELLSSGSPEQVRAALPRMQPEMRRVALMVLGEK